MDFSTGLGSFHFARRYFGNRFFFLFLRLLRCFSSAGSLPYTMDLCMDDRLLPAGFPHSEIFGSRDICSSPKLFAAYHVFHRLLVPRHPPCALVRLIFLCSLRSGFASVRSCLAFKQDHGSIEELNSSALVSRVICVTFEFSSVTFVTASDVLNIFRKIFQFLYAVFKVQV